MRKSLTLLGVVLVGFVFFGLVAGMPGFGDPDGPANALAERYIGRGSEDTGALNAVSAVVLDYRAYDTLGEATVLFSAVAALAAVATASKGESFDG